MFAQRVIRHAFFDRVGEIHRNADSALGEGSSDGISKRALGCRLEEIQPVLQLAQIARDFQNPLCAFERLFALRTPNAIHGDRQTKHMMAESLDKARL